MLTKKYKTNHFEKGIAFSKNMQMICYINIEFKFLNIPVPIQFWKFDGSIYS